MPAALAVEAAGEQGKFWEMHDRLFAAPKALETGDLERHAEALGLDLTRFREAMKVGPARERVHADLRLVERLGVRGTPTMFVNGRRLDGAQPLERIVALVEAERARAEKKLRAGVAPERLYDSLVAGGLTQAPSPRAGAPAAPGACKGGACNDTPAPRADDKVHEIEIGSSPTRGPAGAPVTVVLFSDFECCPYCERVEGTLDELARLYPEKIRFVWKNFPLPFHQNAKRAAVAAMGAHAQGRFWEMHKAIFADMKGLDASGLTKKAQSLGLDAGDDSPFRVGVGGQRGAQGATGEVQRDCRAV
jgi:protein-disulfide isomerase